MLSLKQQLKPLFSSEQRKAIKKIQALKFRRLQHILFRMLFAKNLKRLAVIYGTDKWGYHHYAQHYQTHFSHLRRQKLKILEIGIGGYDDPEAGGGSLRMWRTYFPNAHIYGIDIHDKSCHDERRIKTFQGSQVDDVFLTRVVEEIGSIDIVIDDGSHINAHVLHTFHFLFPHVSTNGFYVVEDTQTSYWPEYGGVENKQTDANTTMGFLKQLADGLNYAEYRIGGYVPTYYDRYIVAMHFYHNLVFIQKGLNNGQHKLA